MHLTRTKVNNVNLMPARKSCFSRSGAV